MNEQELRDEFEKWAMANFNIAPELISDFKYSFTHRLIHSETAFLKGYSLAQETIKAKDAEIKRLNEYADQCKKFVEADCLHCDNLDKAIAEARELIIELVEGDYEFTCDCTTTREKAKAWLENNR